MLITNCFGLTKGSEKRVNVKCDTCGVVGTTTYANYWRSQEKRGWPNTTYCRKCAVLISAKNRRGKPAHNKGKKYPHLQRHNHPSWHGGRYLAHDGYWMIYTGNRGSNGWSSYRKEHIILIEQMLGRKLTPDEVVHHIDGNKQNNSLTNLWVTNHKGHKTAHQSLQEIGYYLVQQGMIIFDQKDGLYKWKNSTT